MEQPIRVEISSGEDTESLLNFIFSGLTDAEVDSVEVEKTMASGGMAREPITTAAVLTLTGTVLVAVVPLIERWMENRRQAAVVEIVAEVAKGDAEAARVLAELDAKHTDTLVKYRAKMKKSE